MEHGLLETEDIGRHPSCEGWPVVSIKMPADLGVIWKDNLVMAKILNQADQIKSNKVKMYMKPCLDKSKQSHRKITFHVFKSWNASLWIKWIVLLKLEVCDRQQKVLNRFLSLHTVNCFTRCSSSLILSWNKLLFCLT